MLNPNEWTTNSIGAICGGKKKVYFLSSPSYIFKIEL